MVDVASTELLNLCNRVKDYLSRNAYKECTEDICYADCLETKRKKGCGENSFLPAVFILS